MGILTFLGSFLEYFTVCYSLHNAICNNGFWHERTAVTAALSRVFLQPLAEIACGPLNSPASGNVVVSGSGVGAQATYSCEDGYTLQGDSIRDCMEPGPEWSGNEPSCQSEFKLRTPCRYSAV